jgi:DNA-binding GntR family transcriptional regulator
MSKASDSAYALIRSKILSGDWPGGSQLKEEILADVCGVSRTPIRDALRRLETEFFIIRENQRTFVAEWSQEDVEDLFALRAMLEAYAAARAAERRGAAHMDRLRSAHDGIAKILRAANGRIPLDIDGFIGHNRDFHRAILDASGSERLAGLLSRLVEQPVVMRTAFSYTREDLERSQREHADLIAAIDARDPAWARAVMTAHIQRAYHALEESRAKLKSRTRRMISD